jgi:hypothetical protein
MRQRSIPREEQEAEERPLCRSRPLSGLRSGALPAWARWVWVLGPQNGLVAFGQVRRQERNLGQTPGCKSGCDIKMCQLGEERCRKGPCHGRHPTRGPVKGSMWPATWTRSPAQTPLTSHDTPPTSSPASTAHMGDQRGHASHQGSIPHSPSEQSSGRLRPTTDCG